VPQPLYLSGLVDLATWACVASNLMALATSHRAIRGLACGFRQEGVHREVELYPDGWQDLIEMAVLKSEYAPAPLTET
jgi:hypothetical protein